MRRVTTATEFRVLGAHRAPGLAECFDAFDLVVTLDSGDEVVLGVRTHGYLQHRVVGAESWDDSYRPITADLDPGTVRHWDFNSIMWVGPASAPCLIWSNAEGFTVAGIRTLLTRPRVSELLGGPDGAGLPTPSQRGLGVPDDLSRHPL